MDLAQIIERLGAVETKTETFQEEVVVLLKDNETLRKENEELRKDNEALRKDNEALGEEITTIRGEILVLLKEEQLYRKRIVLLEAEIKKLHQS